MGFCGNEPDCHAPHQEENPRSQEGGEEAESMSSKLLRDVSQCVVQWNAQGIVEGRMMRDGLCRSLVGRQFVVEGHVCVVLLVARFIRAVSQGYDPVIQNGQT